MSRRPASGFGGSSLSRYGQQAVRGTPQGCSGGGGGDDLPEWGSADTGSYGRRCMLEPAKQRRQSATGAAAEDPGRSDGGAAGGGFGGSTSNSVSADNHFARRASAGGANSFAEELPEWGSGPSRYGRACLDAPPREIGLGPHAVQNTGPTSNDISGDNTLAAAMGCVRGPGGNRHNWSATGQYMHPGNAGDSLACHADLHNQTDGFGHMGHDSAAHWQCADVEDWLGRVGCAHLVPKFAEEAIDGVALLELQDEDLALLGIGKIGERKRLLRQIRSLHQQGSTAGGGGADLGLLPGSGEEQVSGMMPQSKPQQFVESDGDGSLDTSGQLHRRRNRDGAHDRSPHPRQGNDFVSGSASDAPDCDDVNAHATSPSAQVEDGPSNKPVGGRVRSVHFAETGTPGHGAMQGELMDESQFNDVMPAQEAGSMSSEGLEAQGSGAQPHRTAFQSDPDPHSNQPSQDNPLAFRSTTRNTGRGNASFNRPVDYSATETGIIPGQLREAREAMQDAPSDPHSNQPSQDNPLAFRSTRSTGRGNANFNRHVDYSEAERGIGPGQIREALQEAPSDPQSNQPSPDNPLAYRNTRSSSRPFNGDVALRNSGYSSSTGQAPDPHSNDPSQDNPLAFRGAAVLHGGMYSGGAVPHEAIEQECRSGDQSRNKATDLHSNEPSADNPLAYRDPWSWGRSSRPY